MQLKPSYFIISQLKQISEEGVPALIRKLQKLVILPAVISLFILSLPFVLLIILLRPFVVVRLGEIDFSKIGRTYDQFFYLCKKGSEKETVNTLDFFFQRNLFFKGELRSANTHWDKMWRRVLPVYSFILLQHIGIILKFLPYSEAHIIGNIKIFPTPEEHVKYVDGSDQDVYIKYNRHIEYILSSEQPVLSFTTDEEAQGKKRLQKLGIPLDKPFICFHNRDPAYLKYVFKETDWMYHSFRDSDIQNYVLAAEEMTQRGCFAVRLGEIVKENLKSDDPKLIEYAGSGTRTDFIDIYLSAKCRFIICSDTGMSFPAEVFKRPLVYVNWTMILRLPVYALNGLIIFKKFYLKNENRYLTYSENMSLDFGGIDTNDIFSNLGLELIENTPDEILAVTTEMDERLKGTWVTSEEDRILQQRFWSLFGPDKLKSPDLRIGSEYLQQNKDLLV
jgi:putative glycosyltransferase (TIGR04372 family)